MSNESHSWNRRTREASPRTVRVFVDADSFQFMAQEKLGRALDSNDLQKLVTRITQEPFEVDYYLGVYDKKSERFARTMERGGVQVHVTDHRDKLVRAYRMKSEEAMEDDALAVVRARATSHLIIICGRIYPKYLFTSLFEIAKREQCKTTLLSLDDKVPKKLASVTDQFVKVETLLKEQKSVPPHEIQIADFDVVPAPSPDPRKPGNQREKRVRRHSKVAIVTIIGPELQAMKKALNFRENDRNFQNGHFWYEKTISTELSGDVRIQLHVLGEAGNNSSAVNTARIIASGVKFVFLCGIAAGVRGKLKIGDIIVPRAIVDTTNKVAEGGRRKGRPKMISPVQGVLEMTAAIEVDQRHWHALFNKLVTQPLKAPRGKKQEYAKHVAVKPTLHDSVLRSDNDLLRDPQVLLDAANDLHQHIRAGEMEAAGFVQACLSHHPTIPWCVIRGISDFGDELKDDKFHKRAAAAVASYVSLYLKKVLDLRIWYR